MPFVAYHTLRTSLPHVTTQLSPQSSLLDLIGVDSTELDVVNRSNVVPNVAPTTNNQDLLDLLGGLDMPGTEPLPQQPPLSLATTNPSLAFLTENNNGSMAFGNAQNSNFLSGDLLNTNVLNGKCRWFF